MDINALSIDMIGLSVRSQNALHRAGVHTVVEMLEFDEDSLYKVRNLGKKSIDEILEKIKTLPITATEAQKPLRMMLSSAFEVQEDSAGRFLLPQMLRDFAKISKNVVIIGVGTRVEIWSEETWNDYVSDSQEEFDKNFDLLKAYNI